MKPWDPPEFAEPELLALRAVSEGVASKNQQVMAISCIMLKLCKTPRNKISYQPGDAIGTAFAEGKRYVGEWILDALTRPLKPQEVTSNEPAPPDRRNPKPSARRKPAKPDA